MARWLLSKRKRKVQAGGNRPGAIRIKRKKDKVGEPASEMLTEEKEAAHRWRGDYYFFKKERFFGGRGCSKRYGARGGV